MFALVAIYLLSMNVATFAACAGDKRRAIAGGRRVPEKTLLQLAAAGGVSGALAAQRLLRHKTRKEPFRTRLWLIATVQFIALVGAAVWTRH
jgi:uncharacterized membrane protein YsdA (DUF1294 family)